MNIANDSATHPSAVSCSDGNAGDGEVHEISDADNLIMVDNDLYGT